MTSIIAPPAPGPPQPYRFPAATRSTLPSGANVVVASLRKLPLVTVTMLFHRAGADADPSDREGLADLTALMLLEGSAACDGAALTERFELLGSSLAIAADWDAAQVTFTVQPSRLDDAATLVAGVLGAPAFPARPLERIRAEHHAERLQLMAEPRALADAAFDWRCYAAPARYRRPLAGTMASVGGITREAIDAFWRTRYTSDALTIVVAGDVTELHALRAAATLSGSLGASGTRGAEVSASPPAAGPRLSLVARTGAAQTELRIGHVGVERRHRDYFELTVMNAVLGGLFSSRINLNLRERHGYTYGASSGFDWRRAAGPWSVSTAVKTEVTAAAAREVLAEIHRIREKEIAADELELATHYLAGVFPLRFETTAAVAAALAAQATFQLPSDYFDTYRDRVSAVSPADVLRVAKAQLHPDQLTVVVVGDVAAVRTQVDAIGFGEAREWSPEEVERAP